MRIKDDEPVVMSFQGDEEESEATEEEKMKDEQEERKGSVSRDVINFKSSSSGSHTKSNSLTQHSPFFYNSFTQHEVDMVVNTMMPKQSRESLEVRKGSSIVPAESDQGSNKQPSSKVEVVSTFSDLIPEDADQHHPVVTQDVAFVYQHGRNMSMPYNELDSVLEEEEDAEKEEEEKENVHRFTFHS